MIVPHPLREKLRSATGTRGGSDVFSLSIIMRENNMLAKYIMAGLAGSALLTSVAFAQNPTATSDSANTAQKTSQASSNESFQGDWRASKMVGLNVYNEKNENVGSINDLLTDKSGNIKAVVISVGGLLGVGSRLVAVPFDKVQFVNEPVAYTGASGGTSNSTAANRPASTGTTGAANTNTAPATTSNSKANPWYPDHAVFNATKEQLQAMPEFKFSS
jgi:sporulation protein YlmC with PRC-barrel domain